jgi:hypothetical protein
MNNAAAPPLTGIGSVTVTAAIAMIAAVTTARLIPMMLRDFVSAIVCSRLQVLFQHAVLDFVDQAASRTDVPVGSRRNGCAVTVIAAS